MPFVVVEVVMVDELEIVGGMEWEWEIDDVVGGVFNDGIGKVKDVVGAWLIVFKVFGVIPEGVWGDREGKVVELS